MTKIAGSGSISQRQGSADPDPHQNVIDPEHCFFIIKDDKHSPPQVKVLTLKESLTELVKHDQGLVSRGAFAINVVNQVRRRGQPRWSRQQLKLLTSIGDSA